jgi:hypothetical protein
METHPTPIPTAAAPEQLEAVALEIAMTEPALPVLSDLYFLVLMSRGSDTS